MPVYHLHHTGYVSHVETIEAASPEEALAASQGGTVSLCHQCTREWDSAGDPEVLSITDEAGETVWQGEPYETLRARETTVDTVLAELAHIAEASKDADLVRWLAAPTLRFAALKAALARGN
jgi:hypothetical protein